MTTQSTSALIDRQKPKRLSPDQWAVILGVLFSALFTLIITQLHGLGLSLRTCLGVILAYAAAVPWIYSERGFNRLDEIIRIPVIDYVLVFLLAGIFWLILRGAARLRTRRMTDRASGQTA